MIRSKVTEALTEKLGRSPTEEELNEVLEEFSKDESLHSSLLATQNAVSVETSKDTETAGASVDTGASEAANASPEAPADLTAMIRLKLTEVLTMKLGRAPTEEELNEMMEGLSQDEGFHSSLLAAQSSAASRRHQQITRSDHLTLMENLLQLSSKTQVNVHGKKFHPILSLLLLNQPSAGHQDDCIIFNQIFNIITFYL